MSELDICIGYGKRRGNDPLHWMLLVGVPDDTRCTWYHVTGGHQQGYKLEIQAGKR